MSDQNFIDQNSQLITAKLLEVQERTIAEIYALKGNNTPQEFLLFLAGLNVAAIVIAKAKNILNIFEASHGTMLQTIEGFAPIPEETLQVLVELNKNSLVSKLENMGSIIKKEIIQGVVSGTTPSEILRAVRGQGALSDRQLKTLIDTTMNEYSRNVTKLMMDRMPKDTLYVYIGPLDEKTRPICIEQMKVGKQTLSQIKSGFGRSVLASGGVYNCRHKWERSVQDKFGHDQNKAQEMWDKL